MAQNAGQVARAVSGSSCPGCNLFQADFNGLERSGLDFSRARLRQADLSLTVLNRARFSNADLRDVEAYGGVFSSASFAGADLTNASFVGDLAARGELRGRDPDRSELVGRRPGRRPRFEPAPAGPRLRRRHHHPASPVFTFRLAEDARRAPRLPRFKWFLMHLSGMD